MPTVYQKVFVNIAKRRLEISDRGGGEIRIGDLYKYMTLPLQLVLMQEDPDGELGSFERKPVANLALRISINDTLDDTSPLVQATSWDADSNENTLTGEVVLNTTEMNTYIDTASSKSAYFQIEISESGGGWFPVYQQSLTIYNSVTKPSTTPPTPVDEYLTVLVANGTFDKPIGRPGVNKVVVSPNGLWWRVFGVNDSGQPIDDIIAAPV